jgi:predicted enzyme related to lactoylglutathione lyase
MAVSLNGKFVWYELITQDAAAARRFYGEVLGWEARDAQMPGVDYSLMSAAGTDIAGMMGHMEGMQAGWMGYISVDDIDAAFAKAQQGGATAIVPISPIPGVGRFALLLDPQGAAFSLLDYAAEFPRPAVPDHGIQGNGWWRELHTSDREQAFGFYSRLFGWSEKDRIALGPTEVYQAFGDEIARGGILNDPDAKSPYWLFYFWVDDIDATQGRLEKAGGTVLNGPMEVPGGAWIINASDPQGITFALVGNRTKK